MNRINVKRFALAFGSTCGLLYLGCVLVMGIAGEETIVRFFNNLLHGLDVSSIIRMDVPLWEAGIGFVETFVLGWLIGATVAAIYNLGQPQ